MKLKIVIQIAETNTFQILRKLMLPLSKIKELDNFIENARVNLEIAENERSELVKKYGYEVNKGVFQVLPHNLDRYKTDYEQIINQDVDCEFSLTSDILTDDLIMNKEQYDTIKLLITE